MKIRIRSELKGYLTSAYLFLEGQEIHMSYDGDKTYKSTDIMEVDGNLDVTARVYGLNGADWQLTVAATAGDSVACNKIFHRCIEKNQTDLLTKSIPLKQEK